MSEFIMKYKFALIAAVILIVGFIGFSIYVLISRVDKEPVAIYLIPSDTKLLINDTEYQEGTSYLKPGSYKVKASRSGFEDFEQNITVGEPNKAVVDVALIPASESANKWQRDHPELYAAFEGRNAERANEQGEEFTNKNPITAELPFENLLYTIGYRSDETDKSGDSIIITIDVARGYRNAAVDKIRDLGYDPTNFKIEFNEYESPFDHE